ncbi:hypothetical protein GKC56_07985 [Neisseriaceae bacterium PsAf]|nr:hypothetical protein [Neisseriaceae bacterium PsAf]MCV2502524.1 paraquat-inducible protein A [Neisseriaceae bacterium]
MNNTNTETDIYIENIDEARDNSISAREMVCHFCNAEFDIEDVHPGEQVNCPQCQQVLIRIEENPVTTPIIYGLLALFAFLLSLTFPLLSVVIPMIEDTTSISILGIFEYLSSQGFVFLSFVFILFVLITPLIFITATLYVYSGLLLQRRWFKIKEVAYVLGRLRPWIMVDIFFISVIVALVKIRALASVHFGYTMVTLFGYSIFLVRIVLSISDYWLREKILNLEGKTTPFKKQSNMEIKQEARLKIHFSWALLMTAVIFYVPANVYPMMITDGIGFHYASTILEGITEIWNSGDYLISSVIFIASFLIPIAKIFILFIILLAISYKKVLSPKNLTRCYVAIERIGRWSMIDVFVIMLITSLFTSRVVSILPGLAIIYFCLVVVITMLATSIIDTRLLWMDDEYDNEYKME